MTSDTTPNTRKTAMRSACTILSISSPSVESRRTPRIARERWIGTATETTSSPFSLRRCAVCGEPASALTISG